MRADLKVGPYAFRVGPYAFQTLKVGPYAIRTLKIGPTVSGRPRRHHIVPAIRPVRPTHR